ncbi:MAG: hypothetical protein V5786_07885 [Psychromonas sp.]
MLNKSKVIIRHDPLADLYSYHSLRQQGIALAQDYSGQNWTDYNQHDPGVTILEQLCFALSDAIYRTQFDTADYLVNSDNELNLARLGLAPAEDILPCRPCTLLDYQQAIMDAVVEVEQVKVSICAGFNGLYNIDIQLSVQAQIQASRRANFTTMIINKVARIYANLRNVGEDVANIRINNSSKIALVVDIEVAMQCDISEALAQIYYLAGQWFQGLDEHQDARLTHEERLKSGQTLDKILEGPATLYSKANYQKNKHVTRQVSALYTRILAQPQVLAIHHFNLFECTDNQEQTFVFDSENALQRVDENAILSIPQTAEEIHVVFRQLGQVSRLNFASFNNLLQQKLFKSTTLRHTRQEVSSLYQRPKGQYKELQRYYSIQHDFPENYRLTQQGLSARVGKGELAKIKQLRGYLTIFDQFLANFNANIAGIKTFFSIDTKSEGSYYFNYLNDQSIKGVESLYQDNAKQQLQQCLKKYDLYTERKSRVFDYLLALYGETLPDTLFTRFSHRVATIKAKQIIERKASYLADIVSLTQHRGGGFDYTRQLNHKNSGGLFKRLAFHLGISTVHPKRLTSALQRLGLTVVDDSYHVALLVNLSAHDSTRLIAAQHVTATLQLDMALYKRLTTQIKALKSGHIGRALLVYGGDIERYKLQEKSATKGERGRINILFNGAYQPQKSTLNTPWLPIDSVANIDNANQFLALFIALINYLNDGTQGFYLLEHILLRPQQQFTEEHEDNKQLLKRDQGDTQDDFSCQISLILPNFTEQGGNPQFQLMAQQVIEAQCPAHILANVYWLAPDVMHEFEGLYFNWLSLRKSSIYSSVASQETGAQLMRFLRAQQRQKDD